MKYGLAAVALFASLATTPVFAQTLSPFADAAAIVQARGITQNATLRLSYAATGEANGERRQYELTFDVAPDWVSVHNDQQVLLHDFKLDRLFMLDASGRSFISYNSVAPIAFRVMERQNRSYLAQILTRAGVHPPLTDDCDAESELGVAFRGSPAQTSFRSNGGATGLLCNNRVLGSFTAGSGASPPAFWPALGSAINMHPALFERIRADGHTPSSMMTTYRQSPDHVTRLEYRLVSATAIDAPYPLTSGVTNNNAAAIDAALSAGVGAVASDAVAGRAMGGPPTSASCSQYLAQVGAHDGPPAEAMLIGMTYSMFPQIVDQCRRGGQNPACPGIASLGNTINTDTAVHAMYAIASAEQENRLNDIIPEMRAAQSSPLAQHPVFGESYALALLKFDANLIGQARAANLPTDPRPLMATALRAYPYHAAYWTDVGDWLSQQYDWMNAVLFYDVADALPYPEAQHDQALQHIKQFYAQLRRDFPSCWLAR